MQRDPHRECSKIHTTYDISMNTRAWNGTGSLPADVAMPSVKYFHNTLDTTTGRVKVVYTGFGKADS